MSEISASTIAINRYAPKNAAQIELFNYNGAEGMTLSQLIIAVQVRRCACLERDSVVQVNVMNRGVDLINTLSAHIETVLQALSAAEEDQYGADSPETKASKAAKQAWIDTVRPYLIDRGVPAENLPADIGTYDRKMQAVERLKDLLTQANSSVDRVAIEIETCINRRDSMFRIATECVTHGGVSAMNTAASYAN